MIKLDISVHSVVVICTDCEVWQASADRAAAAHQLASTHEEQVHPQNRDARAAQASFHHATRQRHTAKATKLIT